MSAHSSIIIFNTFHFSEDCNLFNKLLFIFLCKFEFIIFSNISLKKSLIFRISFIIYAVFICVETFCNSKNETEDVLNARDVN
jgi:hypothetical protein